MGHQLYLKYGLKEKLARELVQYGIVFPLFDGLDELLQNKQDDFVRVFNEFQAGRSLVLCCRIKEYRSLQEKVALNHAIILQDISEKKLEGHLKRLQLYGLWDFLQRLQKGGEESSLFELARRPLFLNIILTLEEEKSLSQDDELQTGRNAEDRLWQLYLDYCLKEKSLPDRVASSDENCREGNYSKERSLHWLHCLAKHMVTQRKVELRIEELQPIMLEKYWRFGVTYGLIYVLIFGLVSGQLFGKTWGTIFSLFIGVVALTFAGKKAHHYDDSIPHFRLFVSREDWKNFILWLAKVLVYGMLIELFLAAPILLLVVYDRSWWFIENIIQGVIGISFMILGVLTVVLIGFCVILGTDKMLKYYLLRLRLWQENQLPLRLVRWLEFLHHRKILQRVGGSYHFIHKQLLEYLARTHSAQPEPDS
ncbi:MAG: hypothetical protein D3924_16070 [Candidatus Electrothrix sp. AR4]|nr:hypothetical protein [Candidatus Electrothrix sp. AR4]